MSRTARRDAGTGSVYRRADGRWAASVELGAIRNAAGKYVRKRKVVTGKTKAAVVDKLRELRRQLDETGELAPRPVTLAEWLHAWLDDVAAPRLAPATLRAHRSAVERHLVPHLGHVPVARLAPQHVIELHKSLRGRVGESTVLRAHAVLSRALGDAERLGHVRRNVARLVDRPGRGRPDARWLDLAQAAVLLDAVADDPYGSRWAFALLTGQRQGECLGLRWSHVELGDDHGFADIAWQLQRVGYRHGCGDAPCGRRFAGDCPARELDVPPSLDYRRMDGALCLTPPKAGVRKVVPLIPSLAAWLRRHRDEEPPGRHDLVWTRDGHRPVDPRDDHDRWVALLDRCGLPRVTLHSARHTCVSLLVSLEVPENVVMQMVGHSTVAAARGYQHLDRRAKLEAALRLGRALGVEPPAIGG